MPARAKRCTPFGKTREVLAVSGVNVTLIAMGVGVAYLYSVVGVVFPGIFPDSFKEGGEVALYFEAAATIFSSRFFTMRWAFR